MTQVAQCMGDKFANPPAVSIHLGLGGAISKEIILEHDLPELCHLARHGMVYDWGRGGCLWQNMGNYCLRLDHLQRECARVAATSLKVKDFHPAFCDCPKHFCVHIQSSPGQMGKAQKASNPVLNPLPMSPHHMIPFKPTQISMIFI